VRYSQISKESLLFFQLSHIRNLQFLIINFLPHIALVSSYKRCNVSFKLTQMKNLQMIII